MTYKIFSTLLTLSAAFALAAPAHCAWERLRSSDAPLAVVYASTGAYEVAYTVGENCASPYELTESANRVWSGYLSMIPSSLVNQGFYGFDSTSGVTMDGALWGVPSGLEEVKLLFSTDISTGLSSPGISVTQVQDSTGTELNANWPVTMTYSGQRLVIVPDSAWPKGSVFSVYYSSSIVDINGLPVSGATTVYFSVIMDHQADNTASALGNRRVRVLIPANAYDEDFFLTLSTDAAKPEIVAANTKLAAQPGSPEFINLVSVRPYDAAGNQAQPNSACVVSLPYPDATGDGIVDGSAAGLKASNLAIWLLDEERKLWVKQTGASLDPAATRVALPVSHFSTYGLLALPDTDLTPAYAYPVPFRPNSGNPARYGTWAQGITFTSLPAYGRVKIYTISGALVRELDIAAPTLPWDVKNTDGQIVSSGVYLWEITAGKNRKTGKLVIIK
ncbi:MAG: T9SS type A sorting domain-containing protein [Elusimicrobiota bacterium]|nr:T9SS type A sorting domain-containing protein [Elusimicrobiota bacterium]